MLLPASGPAGVYVLRARAMRIGWEKLEASWRDRCAFRDRGVLAGPRDALTVRSGSTVNLDEDIGSFSLTYRASSSRCRGLANNDEEVSTNVDVVVHRIVSQRR